MYISRSGYETIIRKLTVQSCTNLKFLLGTVVGVRASAYDSTKIGSVSVRMHGMGNLHVVPAALVVDCTGLTAGPRWLERAGFGGPSVGREISNNHLHIRNIRESFDPKMRYVSHSVSELY